VRIRALQFFFSRAFFFFAACALQAGLSVGKIYALRFVDIDGNTLLTADGHVTVVVLTTQSNTDQARAVGDRVPGYCLGNPTYRMITVVNFQKVGGSCEINGRLRREVLAGPLSQGAYGDGARWLR